MSPTGITTRSGTSQAVLLACLLMIGPLTALAQEDVAETKATATIDTTPISEPPITNQDRTHWAFRPILASSIPQIPNPESPIRNGIDAFIVAKLKAQRAEPAPQADRPTLLRRLSFDLLGLPPA